MRSAVPFLAAALRVAGLVLACGLRRWNAEPLAPAAGLGTAAMGLLLVRQG